MAETVIPEVMLDIDEAQGTLDLLKSYLLFGPEGQISEKQRRAIGRLLSEVQFTLEAQEHPSAEVLPEGVAPFPPRRR